jgi:hypothetical protein
MFKLVAIICLALSATFAIGEEIGSLTLLSVLGDNINVVTHRQETGSHVDQNRRTVMETAPGVVDTMVVAAGAAAIKNAGVLGDSQVQALVYPGEHDTAAWFDGKKFNPPADLAAAITKTSATRVLLFIAHRAPSMLKARKASMGSGHLDGLGFYVDRETKMRRSDTGEVGVGFLAPYAYMKVILINVATGEVEREQVISASATISVARNKEGFDPWDTLDSSQKVAAINRLVRGELGKVVPGLLR